MIVETVTAAEDIAALRVFNRCVDLTSTYGGEHRNLQTRIIVHIQPVRDTILRTSSSEIALRVSQSISMSLSWSEFPHRS